MLSNKKYLPLRRLKSVPAGGDTIFLQPEVPLWIKVNRTGRDIVELCNGRTSVAQIVATVASEYGITASAISDMVEQFLLKMESESFLFDQARKRRDYERSHISKPAPDGELRDLWLHVTKGCNLACPYCYLAAGNEPEDDAELSQSSLAKVLDEAAKLGAKNIYVSGGEPMLRKDIADILKLCRVGGKSKVHLLTNGCIEDEAALDTVSKLVDYVQVSLDGTNEEENRGTRGPGSFQKAISTIKRLRDLGGTSIILAFTPTLSNVHRLPGMAEFAYDMGVSVLRINRLIPVGRTMVEDFFEIDQGNFYKRVDELYTQLARLHQQAQEDFREIKLSFDVASDAFSGVFIKKARLGCGLGQGILSVDSRGDVYPCAALHNPLFLLGNTNHDSLMRIHENARPMYSQMTVDDLTPCRNCDFRYFCGGGCRALAYQVNGDIKGLDPLCSHYKDRITSLMARFESVY